MKNQLALIVLVLSISSIVWALAGPVDRNSAEEFAPKTAVCKPVQSEPNELCRVEETDAENGPTIVLGYDENSPQNPIYSFMYFVPMISPTMVEMEISKGCLQSGRMISHEIDIEDDQFTAISEIEMKGLGYYKNRFLPEEMIKWNIRHRKNGDELRVLDYIKFEGQGYGRIEITGKIENGVKDVSQVKVCFNSRGEKSPVTIGVYDICAENGQYKYENATNKRVVRVNALTFQKSQGVPRMTLEVACLSNDQDCSGLWASFKGKIANLFIKPIQIDREGNESMLRFGLAIAEKQKSFTFSKAKNLKQTDTPEHQLAWKPETPARL